MATVQEKWKKTLAAINQSLGSATKANKNWVKHALIHLFMYIQQHPDEEFCADMVREWATTNGLPEPPSRLAWGGVFLKAKNAGLIVKTGVKNYHYPNSDKTHTQTNSFWRSA
jgi:hypothetical protein